MSYILNPDNYSWSLYSLPTFVTLLAMLALGVFTLVHERVSPVSVAFFVMSLAVAIWLFCQSLLYSSANDRTGATWAKLAYLGIPFIASANYHFTVVVLRCFNRFKWAVLAAWVVAALFSITVIATDALFSDLYHYSWGPYARYRWLGVPFLSFFAIMLGSSMAHYAAEYRAAQPGRHKRRIAALMLAFSVGYLGVVDFIPAYGIPIYPFGYLAILGFAVLAARAVYTYRLVDITPAFAAAEIVETMNDALLVLDRECNVRVANQEARDLFAPVGREVVGRPVAEIIADPLFTDPQRFQQLLSRGRISSYELIYHPAGTSEERYLSLSASVMRDGAGEPEAIVCIGRDITERKRAEEQVRRQNEYLAALYETSLGLMNRLDLPSLLEAIITRAASLVRTGHGYIYVVEPGRREMAVQAGTGIFSQTVGMKIMPGEGVAGRVWQSREPLVVEDYSSWPGRSPSFEKLNFHAVVGLPLVSGEQVEGVLGIGFMEEGRRFEQDEIDLLARFAQLASIALDNARLYSAAQREIGERRRAESEVKRLNEDLERRVVERTEQLEAAVKELEAFSYSVSHDLRAPLRAVTGFSNAMLEDYSPELDEAAQRYLKLIRDNAQNMGQLIDDLLSFSRMGRQQMEPVRVDMAQLARSVFDEIMIMSPGRKIEFQVANLAPACGDRAMLKQVFVNLLSNAIKYSRNREIACIKVGCEPGDGENIYFVKDNGAGFDMKYSHKLFGVFQRLHSAREFEGTGVGLALVQRIVNRHGGRVWAEGKVGEGATFYFALPVGSEGR